MKITDQSLQCKNRLDNNELIRQGVTHGKQAFTGPEHVVLDVTNRCNNNCIACWTKSPLLGENTPDSEWHKQQLSTELVIQLIDDLASMGTKIIRFTGGGEPFLHPGIFELIDAVKSRNMFCAVTTSLNMIKQNDVDKLIDIGLDELSVSLWAANAIDYVKTHPNKTEKTFKQITRILESFAKHKYGGVRLPFLRRKSIANPRINILNVICRSNCSNIEEMYDYALRIKAESIYFATVDNVPGSTDSLLLTKEDRIKVGHACLRIEEKNGNLPDDKKIHLDNFEGFKGRIASDGAEEGEYDSGIIDAIPCYIGWIFCRIMASGEVVPCCRGVHLTMGNLNNQSFNEIWNSEKYNKFRFMAKNMSKKESFFQKFGCWKTCDNVMHNQELHQRLFK